MRPLRVLIVEDDPGDALLLRHALGTSAEAREVATSAAAVRALAEEAFDAVLLDLSLPDNQGIATVRALRSAAPQVPIVVLTGLEDDELASRVLEDGAQDYLVKGSMTDAAVRRAVRHATERQRHLVHRDQLLELSRLALDDPSPETVSRHVAAALKSGTGADQAAVFDRVDGEFVLVALAAGQVHGHAVSQQSGALGRQVADHGEPALIDDLPLDAELVLPQTALGTRPRSVLVAPVTFAGGRHTFIAAYATAAATFDEADRVFAEGAATVLAQSRQRYEAEHALGERVKELRGIVGVTQDLEQAASLPVICERTAARLIAAMQYPEICWARVSVDDAGHVAGDPVPDDSPSLGATVRVDGRSRGRVEVGYVRPAGFLLPEEQDLLDSVAETIGVWLSRRDAAISLAHSEERLRLLLAQLPAVVWTTDEELTITSSTGVHTSEIELDSDELVGRRVQYFVDDPSEAEAIGRQLRSAVHGDAVDTIIPALGRLWQTRSQALQDQYGHTIGVLHLSLDVSEERRREAELTETRERLLGLWSNALNAMLLVDDQGRFLDANPAAEELTGYRREELVGTGAAAISDLDGQEFDDVWATFLEQRQADGDLPIVRRDGRHVEAELHAVADIVPGVHLAVLHDVTARRRAERELADSAQRFRHIAEHAVDAIYRIRLEPDLAYEYLNPAVAVISGFELDEFRADPMLFIRRCHPDDLEQLDPSRLRDGEVHTIRLRFHHANGDWRWLEDRRAGLVDDGRVVGVQGIIRDVTARQRTEDVLRHALEREQRSVEELRAINSLKSGFLRAVSHELRTPLTALTGFAQTLVARTPELSTQELSHFHRRLLHNAERLETLLTDILDLERLSRGVTRAAGRPVRLGTVVNRVLAEVDADDHPIVVDVPDLVVPVDAATVERILDNLVRNAVKHTPSGTTIWVRAWIEPTTVELAVEDDGPGIPGPIREAVWEPFRQGDHMLSSPSPGTGIGLSLVRQLASAHGGSAWFESNDPTGSRFRARLAITSTTVADHREPVASTDEPDLHAVVVDTLDALATAADPSTASGALLAYVYRLGGHTRPGPPAGPGAIGTDLSLGHGPAVHATIDRDAPTREFLTATLPFLTSHARRLTARKHAVAPTGDGVAAPGVMLPMILTTATDRDVVLDLRTETAEPGPAAFAVEQTRPVDITVDVETGRAIVLLRGITRYEVDRLTDRLLRAWQREHGSDLHVVALPITADVTGEHVLAALTGTRESVIPPQGASR